ncbi:inorganic phosphate transporter [Stappia sp. F7233]|uniref:Phosphate transporter n=1 Tax=Stappia albiluteola TaxID=2758565 RepID=A0A839AES5_9HYPH|nr:inorganic phosphate transporter [Stappia albiluteola]MBA5778193.1 inorganic phosphate transporter [Stappia albiluteola]
MAETRTAHAKATLDKDLDKLARVEEAASHFSRRLVAPGLAFLFLGFSAIVAALAFAESPNWLLIGAAAAIGGYMALAIGANDIANNVGPAVGARAMTLASALAIAAVAESAGALIAGRDVVETISRNIVDPAMIADEGVFVVVMMAALLSAALWTHFATWIGAPVSTTHAVVGGVVGAGLAAVGPAVVNWPAVGAIAGSWVVSPLAGGVIAALFLAFIKFNLIYREDKIGAAKRWVPVLIAVMAGTFAAYLVLKGGRLAELGGTIALAVGLAVFAIAFIAARPVIRRQLEGAENSNQSLRRVFHLPLIGSAALLSFAHGANDVANAIGPLAAIVKALGAGDVSTTVFVPQWVMVIGALGISFGLVLFGPRLIRTVGSEITRLNPMRAYCVALSTAVTVLLASSMGLPVSSTHIAVGGVFGVGFLREWYTRRSGRRHAFPGGVYAQTAAERSHHFAEGEVTPLEGRVDKASIEARRRKLVRRAHFTTIIAAWLITVPAAGLLAASLFRLFQLVVAG